MDVLELLLEPDRGALLRVALRELDCNWVDSMLPESSLATRQPEHPEIIPLDSFGRTLDDLHPVQLPDLLQLFFNTGFSHCY